MDSLTHVLFGIGLAGLSQFHPDIAASPAASQALLTASLIGSVFPDVDTLYRVRGNGIYLRQHRGYTHSVPFLIASSIGITIGVSYLFPDAIHPLWIWAMTSLALFVHVFTDVLNAYGTQIMRPFSKRRTAFNLLPVFDPIIFAMHLIGLSAWLSGTTPAVTAGLLYMTVGLYLLWRMKVQRDVIHQLKQAFDHDGATDSYWAMPTAHPFRWQIGIRALDGSFRTGMMHFRHLSIDQQYRSGPADHPAIARAGGHDFVQALLEFSPHHVVQIQDHPHGTEVRYLDVRYQYRKKFPLLASVVIDHQLEPVHAFVGWSDDQALQRRQMRRKTRRSCDDFETKNEKQTP